MKPDRSPYVAARLIQPFLNTLLPKRRVADGRFCETFAARESVPHPFLRKGWGTRKSLAGLPDHIQQPARQVIWFWIGSHADYDKLLTGIS